MFYLFYFILFYFYKDDLPMLMLVFSLASSRRMLMFMSMVFGV